MKRVVRGLVVALLTALAGCVLAVPVGDYLSKLASQTGRGVVRLDFCHSAYRSVSNPRGRTVRDPVSRPTG